MKLPNPPKIIKEENNKAVFEIEALYPGYGITIGNALRRVLLSSLEGAAVVQMKIKNVPHELSTIPGVLEDVITIMLNLKQLRFKLFTSEPQKASLKIKGKKEVKGSDFQLSPQTEIVNKGCPIATLTSKSSQLEMEIQIEKGIGYLPREARQKEKLEIGFIPVDAIFTPIKNVSYKIENMRVGERTDYDRLFLEIETDGVVSPKEAFWQACDVLVKHFSLFVDTFKIEEEPIKEKKEPKSKKAKSKTEAKTKTKTQKKAKTKTKTKK